MDHARLLLRLKRADMGLRNLNDKMTPLELASKCEADGVRHVVRSV
jgi:hypothetical protein